MECNTKEELLSIIDDMQSRLAMLEDSLTKEEPKDEPADEPVDEPADDVESEDEIEKLLNS